MKKLKDLFLDEVADMYDAGRRIVKALPKLVKAATCEKLKAALMAHLKETEGHVTKLEQVFKSLDQKAIGKTCKTTEALLEEGGDIVAPLASSTTRFAGPTSQNSFSTLECFLMPLPI